VRRRVVVTGLGLVTPIGVGVEAAWEAACAGRSGIGPITLFDADEYPVKVAGEVKAAEFDPEAYSDRKPLKLMARVTRFAVAAAHMAFVDSGLALARVDGRRMGVSMGATRGYVEGSFATLAGRCLAAESAGRPGTIDLRKYLEVTVATANPVDFLASLPNMTATTLAIRYGARGVNRTILTTCASGTQAIGDAARVIERGDADVMLAGGTDSMIHPFGMLGFTLLGALSTNAGAGPKTSRPFDARRDGFVMGEGSGVVVLESLEHARRRGARTYGEIAGYGAASDAFRLTDEPLDGRGAIQAMEAALRDAEMAPGDIDYINAHGTSTQLNDKVETAAIKKVWGDAAYGVPVSSTKSMTGHLIAAAGAVELILGVLAMRDGIVPPTINHEQPDPECDLDYVPNRARRTPLRAVMSNSFGFGGQCAVLIARRLDPDGGGAPCA
jgi:3-oxoacyl-[acyl-carrier-protein] synthase II